MVACMALLSGCTESTIVKPTSETVVGDPNFETQENVEIDWTQVSTDAEDMFKDTSTYEYGRDFHFYMEPNKKQIMLIWVVADRNLCGRFNQGIQRHCPHPGLLD